MEDNRELLISSLQKLNIEITESQVENFFTYKDLLLEWNEKMNLTAIREEKEIIIKHFVDSVSILSKVEIPKESTVIDVGTGAGFPGIPIKIIREDISLTLLDSLNKRITFLEEVCKQIVLKNVDNYHLRAEDGGQNPELREKFDFCVSRAVANLAVLCEYCLPFVKVGGYFVSLKGPNVEQELEEGKLAVEKLGGEVVEVHNIEIPNSDITHSLVIIKKIGNTPKEYPRKPKSISKKPLK